MDISEIDAASNNGVDNIRAIIEEAAFAPSKAKYRVYIIDEVHMLSPGAFNALLKTLEEPPSNVVFILATTEVHKLPATILSRCQRFDFHRIAARDIADRLEYVAQQENIQLEDEAALLIASVADGALRDALSLLDRCMGVSDNITSEVVQKTAGLAGRGHLFDITRSIIDKNVKQALEITQQLYNESKDMGRLCQELLDHFRNLMLIKTMKSPESLIMLSAQEREQAKQQAQEFSLEGIVYVMDVLQKSYDRMFKGGNKRAEMELALIKLTSVQLDTSTEALMARIAKLERMVKNGVTVSPEHKAQSATAEVKEAAAPVVPKINREQLTVQTTPQAQAVASQAKTDYDYDTIVKNAVPMEDWQEVLEVLRKYSITIATSFKNTRAYISGDYILIDSQNELAFKLLKQQSQRERMREAVKEVTGRVYKLGPYKKLEQQDKQENPLDQFIKQAKESGVPVEEE